MPADAALTATFAGLLVSLARLRSQAAAGPTRTVSRRLGSVVVAVGVVAAAVIIGLRADRARAAADASAVAAGRADALAADGWRGTDAAYADLIAPADAVVRSTPATSNPATGWPPISGDS